MRKQIYKDLRKRLLFHNLEIRKNILKYIIINNNNKILKQKLKYKYNNYMRSIIQVKNRCLISNRQHSVYRFFKLSRIKLKEFALQGVLYGVKKASW